MTEPVVPQPTLSAPCDGEVCITCSDQLLTVQLDWVDASGTVARGVYEGQPCEVSVELLDAPRAGDVVLTHGGVALQRAAADAAPAHPAGEAR